MYIFSLYIYIYSLSIYICICIRCVYRDIYNGESAFSTGKLTISMAIFNSYDKMTIGFCILDMSPK